MNYLKSFLAILLISAVSCSQEYTPYQSTASTDENSSLFSSPQDRGIVDSEIVGEASGLAKSIAKPGYFWTHNDSGGEPVIYLIDSTGSYYGQVSLPTATNRDWEDIASGPGPEVGKSYLYIADIGDNMSIHDSYKIYRIPEPTLSSDQNIQMANDIDVIEYVYPDGKRDAETLLLDPASLDLYVISKRDTNSHIYKVSYPYNTDGPFTIEKTGIIPINNGGVFNQIVGGDISVDGMEILLKSYVNVYYWKRENQETSITELLEDTEHLKLPYVVEPQGEGIGFSLSDDSYFTLSESQGGSEQHLFQYMRTTE